MIYTADDYKKDLVNPEFPHIKSRERFKAFYNQLGNCPTQRNQKHSSNHTFFIKPKGRILELGCHWGFNCIYYAKQGFACTGIDVSETLIAYGKEKVLQEEKNIQDKVVLISSFIEDFIPVGKYDTIVLTETLEHTIDPKAVMMKVVECLAEDGLVYISAPTKKIGNSSHIRGINEEQMRVLIDSVGLSIVNIFLLLEQTNAIAKKL